MPITVLPSEPARVVIDQASDVETLQEQMTKATEAAAAAALTCNEMLPKLSEAYSECISAAQSANAVSQKMESTMYAKADFSRGTMAADDCYAWYTQQSGLSCTMQASYNLIGDYCLLSINAMQLPGGWGEVYYSLPYKCVVSAHGIIKSSVGQEMYFSTGYRDGISVLRVAPLNSSETIQEDTDGCSLVVTYKCK